MFPRVIFMLCMGMTWQNENEDCWSELQYTTSVATGFPHQVMWDLWRTKWNWGRFSLNTSVSPADFHSTDYSNPINHPIIQHHIVPLWTPLLNNKLTSSIHEMKLKTARKYESVNLTIGRISSGKCLLLVLCDTLLYIFLFFIFQYIRHVSKKRITPNGLVSGINLLHRP
jgi:hypothetical protein